MITVPGQLQEGDGGLAGHDEHGSNIQRVSMKIKIDN
jgi:hypothetical protein